MPARKQTAIVGLKVRLREPLRKKLEAAAKKRGISLNSELTLRLEQSFAREAIARHLVLAQGEMWAPAIIHNDKLLVSLGHLTGQFGGKLPTHFLYGIVLKGNPEELVRLENYFGGAPYPYEYSNEEIDALGEHWLDLQEEIKRGK